MAYETRDERIVFAVEQIMPLLRDAGVLSLYTPGSDYERERYTPKQAAMANLFLQLMELTGTERK